MIIESTANINNTNASGIFNEITIKIRYKSNGNIITENLELYKENNLENSFSEFKRKKNITDINNEQKDKVFYLIKEAQKIELDKNKTIEELDLKEGDLIEVAYLTPKIINDDLRHNIQNSDSNLNATIPRRKKKNFILIILIVGVAIICLIVSLLCVFLIIKKKDNSNKQNSIDNKGNEEKEDNDDNSAEEDNKNDNNIINTKEKEYLPDPLITNKKLYDNMNILFIYKSNKITNLELETESTRINDEKNFTKIIQNMDFGFLINEKHQEKDELRSLKKNYYTGYLFLLNITINNGTHDIPLLYNKELHESINEVNSEQYNDYDSLDSNTNEINNFRRLDGEEEDNQTYAHENGTSFIKINFYENGQIKNIFTPNDFYEPYMPFFKEIIRLIIPK